MRKYSGRIVVQVPIWTWKSIEYDNEDDAIKALKEMKEDNNHFHNAHLID